MMASQNVLIVEDDVDIRDMLRFSLEKEGFHITEAEDAERIRFVDDQAGKEQDKNDDGLQPVP